MILFCLPPHNTADTQPLETSCFKPLKSYWVDVCVKYLFANPNQVITKFQFPGLFAEAWSKGMSMSNIISGFRTTAVYPFNPNDVLDKVSNSGVSSNQKSTKSTYQVIEDDMKMVITYLYIKVMRNGSESFLPIAFHLESHG